MPDPITISDPATDNVTFPKTITGTHYPIFTVGKDKMEGNAPPPAATPPLPIPSDPDPVPAHTLTVKIIPVKGDPKGKEYTPTITVAATATAEGKWKFDMPSDDLTKGTKYEILATITVGTTSKSDVKKEIENK